MSKKIVYIVPLHKKDDRVFRALSSIPAGAEIVVSCNEETWKWFDANNKEQVENHCITNEVTTYPTLVNSAIKYIIGYEDGDNSVDGAILDVDYISILEFDDTVLEHAHDIIEEYATDWDDPEVLAPLSCVVKEQEGDEKPVLVGIANEAAMAPQMAEEYGLFDFNMMLRTNFLFVNGCYIKPSVFEDYGMFKENFDIFYDYEWALRVVYNGGIIRSIPKATHFHAITDDGAFETHKALPNEVRENWLGAARREYFFEDDREISFD